MKGNRTGGRLVTFLSEDEAELARRPPRCRRGDGGQRGDAARCRFPTAAQTPLGGGRSRGAGASALPPCHTGSLRKVPSPVTEVPWYKRPSRTAGCRRELCLVFLLGLATRPRNNLNGKGPLEAGRSGRCPRRDALCDRLTLLGASSGRVSRAGPALPLLAFSGAPRRSRLSRRHPARGPPSGARPAPPGLHRPAYTSRQAARAGGALAPEAAGPAGGLAALGPERGRFWRAGEDGGGGADNAGAGRYA